MSKSTSLIAALICVFIWGTTFIAQDTGMEFIGPYVFNGVRFFVGFLALIPLFLIFERKKVKSEILKDKKFFIINSMLIGLFLFGVFFLGSILKGVGALVAAIGLGQIIAGYLYPNTSEELTNAFEDFEKK